MVTNLPSLEAWNGSINSLAPEDINDILDE